MALELKFKDQARSLHRANSVLTISRVQLEKVWLVLIQGAQLFLHQCYFLVLNLTTNFNTQQSGPQGSWSVHVCCLHLKMEFRSVVWHHSLLLMNSFNKTGAAVFSCRLCFLRAFNFISLSLFLNFYKI